MNNYLSSALIVRPVTPDDSNDLELKACRALYIGSAGNISFIAAGEDVPRTLPVGNFQELHVQAKRVLSTGTTATNIFAFY